MLAIGARRTFHLLTLFIFIGLVAAMLYARGPYSLDWMLVAAGAAVAFVVVTWVTWFTASRHRSTDFSLRPVWVEGGKPAEKSDAATDND